MQELITTSILRGSLPVRYYVAARDPVQIIASMSTLYCFFINITVPTIYVLTTAGCWAPTSMMLDEERTIQAIKKIVGG